MLQFFCGARQNDPAQRLALFTELLLQLLLKPPQRQRLAQAKQQKQTADTEQQRFGHI